MPTIVTPKCPPDIFLNFHEHAAMARFLILLLAVFFLSSTPVVADGANPSPIPGLIDRAKRSLAEKDEKTFDGLMDQLFERITGFDASSSAMPKGISENQYIEKMCAYARIGEQIFTPQFLHVLRHQMALIAYAVVHEGKENEINIRAMTGCVEDDGRPIETARLMRDGIAWAKVFQAADADQAMSMAQGIEALAIKNPKIRELAILGKLVAKDAQEKHKAKRLKAGNDERRTEEFFPQATLVDRADKGDLAVQLEVALRLETGDKFRQDHAAAYFWYRRALQNGGGETAQAGMDRLLPHLSETDFLLSIDIWTGMVSDHIKAIYRLRVRPYIYYIVTRVPPHSTDGLAVRD